MRSRAVFRDIRERFAALNAYLGGGNGKAIKAVASPSKQGLLYVLDRATGKPVWPIPEVKVPKGDVILTRLGNGFLLRGAPELPAPQRSRHTHARQRGQQHQPAHP